MRQSRPHDAQRGNAFDQASLLIALLRAANIPARYVYGTVEAPLAQVQNWVGGTTNATLAVLNRSLPELAGKRMALSFTPATPTDEETLASFIPPDATSPADLPTSLPAGVIDLVAEYSIDGQTVARGGTYGLGYTVNTRQRLFEPGAGWREIDNTLAAGDYQAVGLDVSGISIAEAAALQDQLQATKAKLDSQQFAGLSKHDLTGAILQAGIVGYFAQTWGKGQIMARTANVLLYRLPSVGTLSTASTVTFWFGVPRRFIPSGVAFDVDRNALSSAAKDDDRARWIAFNRSYNQVLSAHEHSVLEDMFSTPDQPVLGVSTVKAIAVAAQQGQRIYTITQANLSTALNAPVSHHRHRGFERARHGQKPASVAGCVGHGLLRVPAIVGVQGGTARRDDRRGRPLVSEQQNVLGLRPQTGRSAVIGAGMDMSCLWLCSRSRRERGDQFEKSGGEFHRVSLWRGRLWPWAQAQGETGLGEAGIQQQSYLWSALRRDGRTVWHQWHNSGHVDRLKARSAGADMH